MKTFELSGVVRSDFGKKAARTIRLEGNVPCIIYGGQGKENVNFTVKSGDVRGLIFTPEVFIVDLSLDGKKQLAVLKDIQFHPVTDEILHIDFLNVIEGEPVVIDIPVHLKGLAEGVKAGGKLSLDQRKLKVKANYQDLPESLIVNVEKLELGKSIQVGELSFEGLQILTSSKVVVCRVQLTRAARGAAAAARNN